MEILDFVRMSLLAVVATEGGVEYLASPFFDKIAKLTPYKWLLMYASAAVGVGLAFHYKMDFIALAGQLPYSPVGVVATGVFLGRGASYIHSIFSLLRNWAASFVSNGK